MTRREINHIKEIDKHLEFIKRRKELLRPFYSASKEGKIIGSVMFTEYYDNKQYDLL